MRSKSLLLGVLILVMAVAAGCTSIGPQPTPVAPTKTPKPTFTPRPNWTSTPVVFATVAPVAAAPTQSRATVEAPTAEPPAAEPPTATPNTVARLTATQTVNARRGPGTNYPVIGRLSAGQAFPVTGKNARGDWYQFDLDGQSAWVIGDLVDVSGDAGVVQVAQNIPQPPAAPTARPQPRPQPTTPPAAPTSPPAPPAPRYEFNVAVVQRCDTQEGGTWFGGTVYKGGQPYNGARVVFSYAPDGPAVTNPQTSGPHAGYEGWNPGYYSHIIAASNDERKAGTWYVWIVDPNGNRISELAKWTSSGKVSRGEGCNEAIVDFDSR